MSGLLWEDADHREEQASQKSSLPHVHRECPTEKIFTVLIDTLRGPQTIAPLHTAKEAPASAIQGGNRIFHIPKRVVRHTLEGSLVPCLHLITPHCGALEAVGQLSPNMARECTF